MIEICNRGDFVKAQTCRSVFVRRSRGQADHPAERRGFEPLKPFRGLLAFQAGQFNHSCTFPRIKKKNQPSDRLILCGERGIRTPGTVARTPHFECGPIDHSGISPKSPRNGGSPAFRPRRERRLSSFRGCKYKQNFSDCSFSR